MKPFEDLLRELAHKDGSDIYLSTGAPPMIRISGQTQLMSSDRLMPGDVNAIARILMDEEQNKDFERNLEMNIAISLSGVGRFRVNIFKQRNETSIVVRYLKTSIPTFENLHLPPVVKDLVMEKRGLVLFVGGTGSGKSTSLASLIDHRNQSAGGHIITIEEPLEYLHRHNKSIVNQREIGVDARSLKSALKGALRQAPDVLLIGEILEEATMQEAIRFAESGHLVLSTLHASNTYQALDRIINFFPHSRHHQLYSDLALNLKAVVAQRLIINKENKRIPAVEVMLNTPTISDLIKDGNFIEIPILMDRSQHVGMQTFDTHLFELYKEGQISEEEAIANAESKNNLRIKIKLGKKENKKKDIPRGHDDFFRPGAQ